jgi:3-isopropylmalate/(R)-2-methylmalate dehydratase small subunit
MHAFRTHTGILATLDRANVDTDAIIPKQFLKSIKRTGYGPNAFFNWRYLADGTPDANFELNSPRFQGRSILVTRNNFGCGSSREHAVWALMQDGYRAVVAPWKRMADKRQPAFADIFRANAFQNGMLVIELSEEEVETIFTLVAQQAGLQAHIDLPAQTVVVQAPQPQTFHFDIEAGPKQQLRQGLDAIGISLRYEAEISRFEANYDPLDSCR